MRRAVKAAGSVEALTARRIRCIHFLDRMEWIVRSYTPIEAFHSLTTRFPDGPIVHSWTQKYK